MQRTLGAGDFVPATAAAAIHRVWTERHSGHPPLGLRRVQQLLARRTIELPSEPGSRAWPFYDGEPVTHVDSVVAGLDRYVQHIVASWTGSAQARAALARSHRWADRGTSTDVRARGLGTAWTLAR